MMISMFPSDCDPKAGVHVDICIRTETVVEAGDEVEQPDGSMKLETALVEIKHCTNCGTVLKWRQV